MKAFLAVLCAGSSLLFVACESDVPPDPATTNAAGKLGRGIRGEGTLTGRDTSSDPFIKETTNTSY